MVWYAITEFIWGSTATAPKTRSATKIEEGWILVNTDKKPVEVGYLFLLNLKCECYSICMIPAEHKICGYGYFFV